MTNATTRTVTLVLLAALAGGLTPAAGAHAGGPGRAVRGRLLPVPAAGPGQQLTVTAVDVTPYGVIAGTAHLVTTHADGTESAVDLPQRWIGRSRQALALPAGATSGTVTGLTDRGEAAGAVTLDGVPRAVRWSASGRSATLVGGAGSRVSAVGPAGPWGVSTASGSFSGFAELVTRDGTRTLLSGTPELDAGYLRSVFSIGGPDAVLVSVVSGIGRGITATPVLWRGGATVRLPVVSSAFLAPACVSRVRADGSAVASGYQVEGGVVMLQLVRHVGGVPGTDVVLHRATAAGQPVAGLACDTRPPDSLAPDGGVAGFWSEAGVQRAAYWDGSDVMTVVPLQPGESSSSGVAVAGGGRMVVRAVGDDGVTRLSLWRRGIRTPLVTPAGWSVDSVVELTESGLLVANVRDTRGTVRPAAWNVG